MPGANARRRLNPAFLARAAVNGVVRSSGTASAPSDPATATLVSVEPEST